MNKLFIVPLLAIALLAGCKENKKTDTPEVVTVETTPEKKAYTAAQGDAEFKDPKMAVVFNDYILLKTAMVNTDSAAASESAVTLAKSLEGMDIDPSMTKAVSNIQKMDNIEAQRVAFEVVTTQMESMLEGALSSGTIYKQYCPMAFGNTGASWLSNSKQIMNPYFGDKMLKCGRISSEIK